MPCLITALFRLAAAALLLAGCATPPSAPPVSACAPPAVQICPACPVCPAAPPLPAPPRANVFEPVEFGDLPGWGEEAFADSLPGLRAACARFRSSADWQPACA